MEMGTVDRKKDEIYMRMALEEAQRAGQQGEVPIGAILVKGDQVLARDHNRCVELNDPTAHAEILVLRRGGEALGNYRLNDTVIYVTAEPCPMPALEMLVAEMLAIHYCSDHNETIDVLAGLLEEVRRRVDHENPIVLPERYVNGGRFGGLYELHTGPSDLAFLSHGPEILEVVVQLINQLVIAYSKLVRQVLFGNGRFLGGNIKRAQNALSHVMIHDGRVCLRVYVCYLNPAIR